MTSLLRLLDPLGLLQKKSGKNREDKESHEAKRRFQIVKDGLIAGEKALLQLQYYQEPKYQQRAALSLMRAKQSMYCSNCQEQLSEVINRLRKSTQLRSSEINALIDRLQQLQRDVELKEPSAMS